MKKKKVKIGQITVVPEEEYIFESFGLSEKQCKAFYEEIIALFRDPERKEIGVDVDVATAIYNCQNRGTLPRLTLSYCLALGYIVGHKIGEDRAKKEALAFFGMAGDNPTIQ